MGILDALTGGDDPAKQQGMTALAAGLLGGGSFNEALSRGLQNRQAAVNDYTRQQLMKEQLSAAVLDRQMKALQMQRMGDAAKTLQQMQAASGGAVPVGKLMPGQAGSGTMGIEPVPNGGDQFRPTVSPDSWQWLRQASPEQLQALKLGDMDMTDLYKIAIEPKATPAGSYVTLPGQGTQFMVNPKDALTVNNGRVGVAPGGIESLSAITAANKGAEMKATNQNTLAPNDRLNPATGRPYDMNLDQLIGSVSGVPAATTGSTGGIDISALKPDQITKMAMSDPVGFRNAIVTFQQSRNAPPAVGGSTFANKPSSGFNGFMGPEDNLKAAAGVEIAKNRNLKADDAYQTYKNELQKGLTNDNQTISRNSIIEPLLDKYKTGKLGQTAAIDIASYMDNSDAPDWMKNSIKRIVGEKDPATGKLIENQLSSAALTTMLQTLDGQGKPNMAIFKALTPAQEGIESGNVTLKDVFAVQKYLRDTKNMELHAMAQAEKDPKFDRGNWSSNWGDQLDTLLKDKPLLLPSKIAAVPPRAVADLKMMRGDPKALQEFDDHFGPGMAAHFLKGK